jgi:ribosomal-protein-alanine N-acetyltransferase
MADPAPHLVVDSARREAAELEAIGAIDRASFPAGSVDVAEELDRPWARIWVARFGEGAVPSAFLLAWLVADELHVLSVATHPSARRRGLARALLAQALAAAREKKMRLVLLEVRRSNQAAIRLYRGFGFRAMGVRPGYYADNREDAIEMILVLDPLTGEIQPGRDEVRLEEAPPKALRDRSESFCARRCSGAIRWGRAITCSRSKRARTSSPAPATSRWCAAPRGARRRYCRVR